VLERAVSASLARCGRVVDALDRHVMANHNERVKSTSALLIGLGLLLGWSGLAGAAGSSSFPVQVRVSLTQHEVTAGQPIKGSVVLTNTTHKMITVNSCAANGWLQVGLKGHGYTYSATSLAIACAPSVRLRPGANRFPVTVLTSYEECLQPGGQSLTSLPACTATGQPPLPTGKYSTVTSIFGLPRLTQAPDREIVTLHAPAK
jgi:hypothetical protein